MAYLSRVTTEFDTSYTSAFNTLETADLTYLIQGDFVYGINTQIWNATTVSGTGAAIDTNASRLRIQCGTNSAGYAYITSRRIIRYRAGQGINARFTPLFGTPQANNLQLWGVGTVANNAPVDGYFFGYNGTSFGIAYYNATVLTFITQASFNGDTLNGSGPSGITWNPLFGTAVMIKYPFLGFGNIFFYVQNSITSTWILAHTIKYANTTSTTALTNPALQFVGFTKNSGNTTNITMYCGSVGIAISGNRAFTTDPKWSIDNQKTGITTETCLLNLQNVTTYNGIVNKGMVRLTQISGVATSGGTNVTFFRFKLNGTIGGTPSYSAINGTASAGGATITNGNSITTYDIAGTTISGGTLLLTITCLNSVGEFLIDLTNYEIYLAPGEILSITGTSSASAVMSVSVNWQEDI